MLPSISATVAMLVLGVVAKVITRDWLHPAVLFPVFWAFACGASILVAPENISSGSGPLWILLNTVFVSAGAVTGTAFASTSQSRRAAHAAPIQPEAPVTSNQWLRRVTGICILLAMLYVVLFMRLQGIDAASLISLRSLARTAMIMSVARYSGTVSTPLYIQLLLTAAYLAPLFGGALYLRRQKRSDTALALLSMLPSLACFATQSTRSSVLFGGTMWVAGYLSMRPYLGIKAVKLKKRTLILFAAAVPLMLLMIAVGDSLRGGGASGIAGAQSLLSNRTKTYFSGHIAALSQWLDNTNFSTLSPSPGQYTVAGAYELIHPGTRVGGVIGQVVSITTGYTNVFTYFRELIEDATLTGSLVVMLVLGFCGGCAYRKVSERRAAWIGILAAFYAGALFGLTSIFDYNSLILALALYLVVCVLLWHEKEILAWAQ
jgi:oligosaccharide repeat unit polymerase